MKKLLALTSVVVSISAASAFAKTEGNYAGVDLLRGNIKVTQRYSNDSNLNAVETTPAVIGSGLGVGLNFKHAHNFDGIFVAPGVFIEQNNLKVEQEVARLHVKNRYGVKVDFGYDVADNIAPYVTVGYAGVAYRARNVAEDSSSTAVKNGTAGGLFYGVGLKLDVNKDYSFNVEYQTQNFRAKTRTDGTAHYSGVFKSNFNQIKLGVSRKF